MLSPSLYLILINVPAFMILSLVCDLIKQSVSHLAASSPISSWFPCILLKYLHYNLSFSLFSTDRSAVTTPIIIVDTVNNNDFNLSSLNSRQRPADKATHTGQRQDFTTHLTTATESQKLVLNSGGAVLKV